MEKKISLTAPCGLDCFKGTSNNSDFDWKYKAEREKQWVDFTTVVFFENAVVRLKDGY